MASTTPRPAPPAKRAKLDTTGLSLPQVTSGFLPPATANTRPASVAPQTPAAKGMAAQVGTPGVALPAAWGTPQLHLAIDPALHSLAAPQTPQSSGMAPQSVAGTPYAQIPTARPYPQAPYAYLTGQFYPPGALPYMPHQQRFQPHIVTSGAVATPTTPAAPAPRPAAENQDLNTLNDAVAVADIDVAAEDEGLRDGFAQSSRTTDDRSRKQSFIDTQILAPAMRDIATQHKLAKGVADDAVNYMALALRTRLHGLITSAISASKHRQLSQPSRPPGLYEDGTPMWSEIIRKDVGKQLSAIEKVDREEERVTREARAQRAAGKEGTGDGDEEGRKRKAKQPGPGVAAKNMSEEARKKQSDQTAAIAYGGRRFGWMEDTVSTPAIRKTSATPTPAASTPPTARIPAATSGWARAYQPQAAALQAFDQSKIVTLRDLTFVIDRERGHGGGRGSARGWT